MYVDVEFKNVTYCSDDKKNILNGINGKFHGGKLTGILGPSGAGKSTLLNILAGLTHDGVSGDILINNKPRINKSFNKISAYIMQDDVIQHHLTVAECMEISANLKLGKISKRDKEVTIGLILKSMCLEQCKDTRTQYLSGGQRKRLIIALELVNNPPVIFLDEPTTGLDEITLTSCMKLLKSLTGEGRTIICTIHQPSDNVFNLFDDVYFLIKGKCAYKGPIKDIIPFLNDVQLSCPINYNPADYLIELISENAECEKLLCQHTIEVEKINEKMYPKLSNCENLNCKNWNCENWNCDLAPFWYQVNVLLARRFKQIIRNKLHLSIEIGHNFFCGIFIGMIFYQMGNNATMLVNNIFVFYALNNYLIFTHAITIILTYPFELRILEREHMNRWYSLKAYYTALNISIFPIPCFGTIILCVIIYYMTGQPTDQSYRILWLILATILYGLASQGLGLTIASIFNPVQGAVVGSTIGISLVLLSICTNGYGDQVSDTLKVFTSFSYVYHAYSAYLIALFRSRAPAQCDEIFCHFSSPGDLLKRMGMSEDGFFISIAFIGFFVVLHRVLAYFLLKGRLNADSKLYRILQNIRQ